MANVLIIAEHDGSTLNPSAAKCVTCATGIQDATIDVLVLAADGDAVAAQAAEIAGVSKVLVANNPANEHALAAVLAPQVAERAHRDEREDHELADGKDAEHLLRRVPVWLDQGHR